MWAIDSNWTASRSEVGGRVGERERRGVMMGGPRAEYSLVCVSECVSMDRECMNMCVSEIMCVCE